MSVKDMIRGFIYGPKATSASYVSHLRSVGMVIGENTIIYSPTHCIIDATRPWMVEIGNNVSITRGVTILTHGYDWSVFKGKYGDVLGSAGRVKIGDNVFIGMNATVLKGVTIGDNVVIGANSLPRTQWLSETLNALYAPLMSTSKNAARHSLMRLRTSTIVGATTRPKANGGGTSQAGVLGVLLAFRA